MNDISNIVLIFISFLFLLKNLFYVNTLFLKDMKRYLYYTYVYKYKKICIDCALVNFSQVLFSLIKFLSSLTN